MCLFLYTGSTATLTEVRVPDCNVLPCIVYRGTNVTVEYDFTASKSTTCLVHFEQYQTRLIGLFAAGPSNTLNLDVTGNIAGTVLPWYDEIDFYITCMNGCFEWLFFIYLL